MRIKKKISTVLLTKNLTQKQLAKKLGVSEMTLSRVLHRGRPKRFTKAYIRLTEGVDRIYNDDSAGNNGGSEAESKPENYTERNHSFQFSKASTHQAIDPSKPKVTGRFCIFDTREAKVVRWL